jgi:hypothetical protein
MDIRLSMQVVFWVGWGEKQRVPMFPKKFPIGSHFYPICFGRCPPFSCIDGPKGKASLLHNRTFYFGEPLMGFIWGGMDQSNWLITKKKNWTLEYWIGEVNRRGGIYYHIRICVTCSCHWKISWTNIRPNSRFVCLQKCSKLKECFF